MNRNRLAACAVSATLALFTIGPVVAETVDAASVPALSPLAARLLPAVVNISTTQTIKDGAKPSEDSQDGDAGPDQTPAPQTDPAPGHGDGQTPFDEFFKEFFKHQGDGKPQADRAPHGRKAVSLGSGFIIDKTGYVVTNNHVIADADEITVILQDNTNLKATLIGRDEKTDLALLKVNTEHPLDAVSFGDSDAERVGDWVMAVGNPFGLGGTVTSGIVSARGREINGNNSPYDDFLQTDAPINRGNSGGPLFNMDGKVIGINSAIFSPSGGSIGIGFAIPSNLAAHIVGELRQFGKVKRGYLGARIQDVGPEVAADLGLDPPTGALVAGLLSDDPSGKTGLAPGDIVLALDDKKVSDARHLQRLVADSAVDVTVPAKVWRDGAATTVSVKISEAQDKPDEPAAPAASTDKGDGGGAQIAALGLTLAPTTPALKEKYQLDDEAAVVVTGVTRGGPAADKDLKPGDVVVTVAQEEVKDPGDITRKIDEARKAGRKSVLMLIDRSGDLRFVALRIDHPDGPG